MSEPRPTIVIDTREQEPLVFERLAVAGGTLYAGDYSVSGGEHLFSVERKSIADLVGSVTSGRERFERELVRLRGYRFKRLLIVGTVGEIMRHEYKSKALPSSVLHSISAFEVRYDVPVVWAATASDGGRKVEGWATWFAREMLNVVKAIEKGAGK